MSDQNIPQTPNSVQQKYLALKKEFELAFKEFHKKVLSDKVLDKNKSPAAKNTEKFIVDRLIKSAVALDNANYGEGLLALCTVMMRELITTRDRVNELDYEICINKRDIKLIKKSLDIKDDKK